MKKLLILPVVLIALVLIASPVFAIDDPDSDPSVESTWVWRNVLETDDQLYIAVVNTPYATIPTDYTCSEAYIWHLMDTDGTTELAQGLTYDYNDAGYGYNVIGFYLDADDAPTWGEAYKLKVSQTPAAFTEPEEWLFELGSPGYSTLTETAAVKVDISAKIIGIASDFDNKWGLDVDYSLVTEIETGSVLSVYGEAFFRGAFYGLQAYAPYAFSLIIENIDSSVLSDREWDTEYSENLSTQFAGTPYGDGVDAGNDFLGTDYNLFGMGITAIVIAAIVGFSLAISSDWWGSIGNGVAPLVIFTRMGMFGMGELALVAAVGWLFLSAKQWKVI